MVIRTAVTGPRATGSSATDVASNPSDLELSADAIAATPSELDLLSEIDLLALGPVCPGCKKMQPAGAKICVTCGINLATGESILPTGKGAPQNLGYARERQAISSSTEPQRSYWSEILRSFAYPFWSANNLISLAMIAVVAALQEALSSMGVIGLSRIILAGWLASVYLRVVQNSAMGLADLPGLKMEDGWLDDIFKPALKYAGAYFFAMCPVAAYVILVSSHILPEFMVSMPAMLLWAAFGIFAWPILVMLFAFDSWSLSFRVDLIITTIAKTFLPYLALWASLLIVGFVTVLPLILAFVGSMITDADLTWLENYDVAFRYGRAVFAVYVTIVAMRQIGLYYLHFSRKMTFTFD